MTQETKKCQNCKKDFIVENEDFQFYKKIKVPPPTWCPDCRLQRRLSFFNLINLYYRKCDLCGEDKVSVYSPDAPYKVYCPQCWHSDDWDPFEYGRDYDFSRPFFEQFMELKKEVPLLGLSLDLHTTRISPHNNHCGHVKNCYLIFHGGFDEDSAYGIAVDYCKSVFDCSLINSSELCYDSMHSYKNNRCVGSRSQVYESLNCFFLKDCSNCQDCFASANLRNKKYYVFNKPYNKEDYQKEVKKWDLGSYKIYKEIQKKAEEHWNKLPPKPHMDEFTVNYTGNYVFQSKNCKDCYEVGGAEDCRFLFLMGDSPIKDSYDISSWGNNVELCYEGCVIGENVYEVKFCEEAGINLHHAEYSKLSLGGSYHFGCISAKKGEYCILNKKYNEEEFKNLRAKIIKHMDDMPYKDKKGTIYKYGDFFPFELSPFAYNETLANNFFPLNEEKAKSEGFKWKEKEERSYEVTMQAKDLPDHIREVKDNILKETISCGGCGRGYRIIMIELDFLRRMNLPLPRECPFCRVNSKLNQWMKNLRAIDRICDNCGASFLTKYPKEETPYILCKECYLKEVA